MLLVGQQFSRYRLQRLIEQGGMGEIYLAIDTHLHRNVAIKVVKSIISSHADAQAIAEAVRLFQREARAVTMLEHPHILPLYDYGEEELDGILFTYFVMPYRQAGSLAGWVSKRGKSAKITLYEAAHFLPQAANALQYAHDHDIIHRDVKPSNFLLVYNRQHPGRPDLQLTDFGVAKFMKALSTPTGIIRGTPLYMAPEQWIGGAVPASDQYALAVMMYQFLTGRPPFQGENYAQLRHEHAYEQPPLPGSLNPRIPNAVDDVLMKALAKDPEHRYKSIDAFARAFQHALPQKNIEKTENVATLPSSEALERTAPARELKPLPPMHSRKKPPNQMKSPIFILGLALLLVISGLGFVLYSVFHQTGGRTQGIFTSTQLQSKTAIARLHASETSRANQDATASSVASDATNTAVVSANASAVAATATAISVSAAQTAVSATKTAVAGAIATSATATATAFGGILMVGPNHQSDPLLSSNAGFNWDTVDISSGAGCTYTRGTYHAGDTQTGNFSACFEHQYTLTDFSYQVNMTILQGDIGGIAFRADPISGTFYYFSIDTHGNYALTLVNSFTPGPVLKQGFSAAIHAGLNQTNQIAVIAKGNSIMVYVNKQLVVQVTDSTNTSGNIGVVGQDVNNSTDVSFSDAQIWY